jgi:hypothetical protein
MTKETIPQKEKIFKNKRGPLLVLRHPLLIFYKICSPILAHLPTKPLLPNHSWFHPF